MKHGENKSLKYKTHAYRQRERWNQKGRDNVREKEKTREQVSIRKRERQGKKMYIQIFLWFLFHPQFFCFYLFCEKSICLFNRAQELLTFSVKSLLTFLMEL